MVKDARALSEGLFGTVRVCFLPARDLPSFEAHVEAKAINGTVQIDPHAARDLLATVERLLPVAVGEDLHGHVLEHNPLHDLAQDRKHRVEWT